MKPQTRKERIRLKARAHRQDTMVSKIKNLTENYDKLEKRLKSIEDKK